MNRVWTCRLEEVTDGLRHPPHPRLPPSEALQQLQENKQNILHTWSSVSIWSAEHRFPLLCVGGRHLPVNDIMFLSVPKEHRLRVGSRARRLAGNYHRHRCSAGDVYSAALREAFSKHTVIGLIADRKWSALTERTNLAQRGRRRRRKRESLCCDFIHSERRRKWNSVLISIRHEGEGNTWKSPTLSAAELHFPEGLWGMKTGGLTLLNWGQRLQLF